MQPCLSPKALARQRGPSHAYAEPAVLIELLKKDDAITKADTLLLTIPNQLGVAYNAHVMESILTRVPNARLGLRRELRSIGRLELSLLTDLRVVAS